MRQVFDTLKAAADRLKRDTAALYLAARDPRTPWYAKAVAFSVVAYALSPIDLIPDFVPVLGYIDDLLLLPLGIALSIRLVPAEVLEECRLHADERLSAAAPGGRMAAVAVIAAWVAILLLLGWPLLDLARRSIRG